MPRLLMRDTFLGTVTLVKDSSKRWTMFLKPARAYYAIRPIIQGGLPDAMSTTPEAAAFRSAFAQAREGMRQLGLRLEEDAGQLIETSEIVLSDFYPADTPEDFFVNAEIAGVAILP